jgi:hypothetical protein
MHYCLLLLTKEIPSESDITNILLPYYEYNSLKDVTPFIWDDYSVGGRYGGRIKYRLKPNTYLWSSDKLTDVKIKSNLFDKLNKYYKDEIMEHFNSEVSEIEFAIYLGARDDIIYCDGAYLDECDIGDLTGYYCLNTITNKVITAESKRYKASLKRMLNAHPKAFITVIDIHN